MEGASGKRQRGVVILGAFMLALLLYVGSGTCFFYGAPSSLACDVREGISERIVLTRLGKFYFPVICLLGHLRKGP